MRNRIRFCGKGLSPVLLAAVFVLAACTTRVESTTNYTPMAAALPRPDVVVVNDFVADPGQVQLDPGRNSLLRRPPAGVTPWTIRQADAGKVQDAITTTLFRRVGKMGIPVVANSRTTGSSVVLSLEGRVQRIDEGNLRRRTVVGLGAGKSVVVAELQVIYRRPGAEPRLLQTLTVSSDSGRAPGAAETMGVGAAAGNLGVSAALSGGTHLASESRRAGVDDEADRAAEMMADNVQTLLEQHGWVPPPAK